MKKITKNFTDEALSAPHLFSDLAKVELYIAESYRTRAIIEMLQNADDAGATKFFIRQNGERLIVANNGQPFCDEDLISLCRSGSSTKTRGSGQIGYRGIGFKSVAGICKSVKVLSNNLFFEFSKILTQNILGIKTDVPLIRIPHPICEKEIEDFYKDFSDMEEYKTIFILDGIDIRLVEEEIELFDSSSILFLNNTMELTFCLSTKKILLKKRVINDSIIEIETSNKTEKWNVRGTPEIASKVALKYDGENIISASDRESVIHAFLPTEENPGACIKMNGDFSTDPSRKRIDLDDTSNSSFKDCCQIISNDINMILSGEGMYGFFSIFKNAPNGRFKKLLKEHLFSRLKDNLHIKNDIVKLDTIRTKPDWINYQDYSLLKSAFYTIPKDLDEAYPELYDFLSWLGVKELSVEECLTECDHLNISIFGSFEIICRAAKKFRFNLPNNIIEVINNKAIYPTQVGLKSGNEIANGEYNLLPDYLKLLREAENASDLKIILKRAGINSVYPVNIVKNKVIAHTESHQNNTKNINPQVKKWRSAELNVKEWFSGFSNVLLAKDVSKSHVGYDIEVKLKDGKEYYVEVKSVISFSDAFEITNNEYAIGSQLKENYLINIGKPPALPGRLT